MKNMYFKELANIYRVCSLVKSSLDGLDILVKHGHQLGFHILKYSSWYGFHNVESILVFLTNEKGYSYTGRVTQESKTLTRNDWNSGHTVDCD